MSDSSDQPSPATLPEVFTDLSERLATNFGDEVDLGVSLNPAATKDRVAGSADVDRLGRANSGKRYRYQGELARGGMGAVLGIYDEDLRRPIAMKVMRGQDEERGGPGTVDRKELARFIEEAQVTAQLDHPGVVPIHELGMDREGRVYFTMKRVKGEDLRAIYEKVASGEDGWSRTRALGVLQRMCEAMAFAHSKGVIHRDLKPGNVMVGRFGEAYVMDWGLARVLGKSDRKDLRIRPEAPRTSRVRSSRREDATPDSPLVTMDGDVVGTPAYMPPEQAEGRVEDLGPQADVYSLGAMLYELLAGHMPYVRPRVRMTPHTILSAVIQGPPTPLGEIDADLPPELVAVCEKAMTRDLERRYPDMGALAEDLRAFLEGRVVQAYRTGTLVQLRKWVQRNRGLAAALLVAAVLLLVAVGSTGMAVVTGSKNAEIQGINEDLDTANGNLQSTIEERDAANTALAESNAELDRRNRLLGDLEILRDLRKRESRLWPARPNLVESMDDWLREAGDLLERIPVHARELSALLEDAAPVDDAAIAAAILQSPRAREYSDAVVMLGRLDAELDALADGSEDGDSEEQSARRADLAEQRPQWLDLCEEIEAEVRESLMGRFPGDPAKQGRHDNLKALVVGAQALNQPSTGLVASVEERRDRANRIEEDTIGEEHEEAWDEALTEIALSDRYDGLELDPIVGLVPIGADRDSGLWEFWHFESGSRPVRDEETGRIVVTDEMGIVLVLIPGGTFWMGASQDPASPNHDPEAESNEEPVHEVTLEPYLLSKYELTQGQWFRFTGERPSQYGPGQTIGNQALTDRNPVERVSWDDGMKVLPRFGLRLPTEAQWEHAARAESTTPWWCGDRASIGDADGEGIAGNVFDAASLSRGAPSSWGTGESWADGHTVHAPVGSFRPSRFGLHDVIGNIREWCEDLHEASAYDRPVSPEDGHRLLGSRADGPGDRVIRGGSFDSAAVYARSANRNDNSPSVRHGNIGLRPAQGITRD